MTHRDIEELKVGNIVICETHCTLGDKLIFFKKKFEVLKLYKSPGEVDIKSIDTGDIFKKVNLLNCKNGIISLQNSKTGLVCIQQ